MKVWVVLVLDGDQKSATKVVLDDDADVDDLRKGIVKEWQLTLPAGELTVYQDKNAFDTKSVIVKMSTDVRNDTTEEAPYFVVATSPASLEGKSSDLTFIELLKGGGIVPDKNVLRRMQRRLAVRIANAVAAQSVTEACDTYWDAETLPSTATERSVKESTGIHLNGPLLDGNAELIICYKNTKPMIIKFHSEKEANRMIQEFADMKNLNTVRHLVTFEWHGRGMLMPFFASTLQAVPRLEKEDAWKLWDHMSEVLCDLHDRKVAHMDVKPANIFVDHEGSFILGDLGSMRPFSRKTQSTRCFVPRDMQCTNGYISSAKIDWWMLAMTFCDKVAGFEAGASATEPTCDEIKTMLRNCSQMADIVVILEQKLNACDDG